VRAGPLLRALRYVAGVAEQTARHEVRPWRDHAAEVQPAAVDAVNGHRRAHAHDAGGSVMCGVRSDDREPTIDAQLTRIAIGAAHAAGLRSGVDELSVAIPGALDAARHEFARLRTGDIRHEHARGRLRRAH